MSALEENKHIKSFFTNFYYDRDINFDHDCLNALYDFIRHVLNIYQSENIKEKDGNNLNETQKVASIFFRFLHDCAVSPTLTHYTLNMLPSRSSQMKTDFAEAL